MARREMKATPLDGTYRLVRPTKDGKTHVIMGRVKDPRREGVTVPFERQVAARSDADAYRQRDDLLEEIRKNGLAGPPDAHRATLGALGKSWLAAHAPTIDEGTKKRYAYELRLIMGEKTDPTALGNLYAADLTAQDIQALLNRLASEGRSREGLRNYRSTLYTLIRKNLRYFSPALREDLFMAKVVDVPNVERGEDDDAEDYTPPVDLVRKFLGLAREHFLRHFLFIDWKVTFGIRGAHLLGVKFEDVDRAGMFVRMRRKVYDGRVGQITERKPVPKRLPLVAQMLADFDAHVARLKLEQNPAFAAEGWLFPGTAKRADGTYGPMDMHGLRKAWAACCKAVGIDEGRWKPHGARGSFYDVLRGKVSRASMLGVTAHTEEMAAQYETVSLEERRGVVALLRHALKEGP